MNKSNENHEEQTLLELTITDITTFLEEAPSSMKSRLQRFVVKFDKEFPRDNETERTVAEAIVYILMRAPLFLYAIEMNGASILELHAILERLTLEQIVRRISKPSTKKVVEDLAEKRNLPNLAEILCKMGVLDKSNVSYARRLSKLRNGVAHRNPKVISNAVLSGKEITFLDIDKALSSVDCMPLIIRAVPYVRGITKQ